jgi:hypothetical protein
MNHALMNGDDALFHMGRRFASLFLACRPTIRAIEPQKA